MDRCKKKKRSKSQKEGVEMSEQGGKEEEEKDYGVGSSSSRSSSSSGQLPLHYCVLRGFLGYMWMTLHVSGIHRVHAMRRNSSRARVGKKKKNPN